MLLAFHCHVALSGNDTVRNEHRDKEIARLSGAPRSLAGEIPEKSGVTANVGILGIIREFVLLSTVSAKQRASN
jgi:hypothetical protein